MNTKAIIIILVAIMPSVILLLFSLLVMHTIELRKRLRHEMLLGDFVRQLAFRCSCGKTISVADVVQEGRSCSCGKLYRCRGGEVRHRPRGVSGPDPHCRNCCGQGYEMTGGLVGYWEPAPVPCSCVTFRNQEPDDGVMTLFAK